MVAEVVVDRQGLSIVMDNFWGLCERLGQYKKAIGLLEQVSVTAKELGLREGQGHTSGNLALFYQLMGQYEKAITLKLSHYTSRVY